VTLDLGTCAGKGRPRDVATKLVGRTLDTRRSYVPTVAVMPQGTQGTTRGAARKPQTGTARQASKDASRERMIERTKLIVDNRPLMTIEQVARYLGVSRWTIGRMLDDGSLRGVTVNGRRKVRPADVDAMLDAS